MIEFQNLEQIPSTTCDIDVKWFKKSEDKTRTYVDPSKAILIGTFPGKLSTSPTTMEDIEVVEIMFVSGLTIYAKMNVGLRTYLDKNEGQATWN